jgi:hypothetical protein
VGHQIEKNDDPFFPYALTFRLDLTGTMEMIMDGHSFKLLRDERKARAIRINRATSHLMQF